MKTLFVFLTTCLMLFSQNDLVVFSKGQEKFLIFVNGVRQNNELSSNVRVTRIIHPKVQVRIKFENASFPEVVQTVFFLWNGEEKRNWEFVYQLKKNKSGKWILTPFSAAPLNGIVEPVYPAGQSIIPYHDDEWIYHPPAPTSSTQPGNTPLNQTVTTTTVISGSGTQPQQGGVVINIGVPNSQPTQTTITSTTISSSNPGANTVPCLLSDNRFAELKKSISSKNFDNSRLEIAKQAAITKCLKSSQIRDIMKLFSFENTRLEFAKFAYNKTIDKENYFLVNDAFQFESTVSELNEYINGHKD
jgi:hypothetical protein